MAYIVKSSLAIEPTILPWNESKKERLIKEKEEFLKKQEEIVETVEEVETEKVEEEKEEIAEPIVEEENVVENVKTPSSKSTRNSRKVGEE